MTYNPNLANPQIRPSTTTGIPTSGNHAAGEIYVDVTGAIFFCTTGGNPGFWVSLTTLIVSAAQTAFDARYLPFLNATTLTATAGNNQVSLSITSVTSATSYNIKRATVSGGPYTIISQQQTGLTFVDSTAVHNTTYYYLASPLLQNVEGPNSLEVNCTPYLTIAYSPFTGGNSGTLPNDTTVKPWVVNNGTFGISGGYATLSTASAAPQTALLDLGVSDNYTLTLQTTTSSGNGAVIKAVDANNFIEMRRGTALQIYKCVSGTETFICNAYSNCAANDLIGCSVSGYTYTFTVNGVVVYSIIDSSFASGTKAGLVAANTGDLFGPFRVIQSVLTAPTIIFSDIPNRGANASLGTTDTGSKAWSAISGTWAINVSNQFVASGGGDNISVLDAGASDGTISFNLVAGSNNTGVALRRAADGTTDVWKSDNGVTYAILQRYAAGTLQRYATGNIQTGNLIGTDGMLKVVLSGQLMALCAGPVVLAYIKCPSSITTNTKHGLFSTGAGTIKNISMTNDISLIGAKTPTKLLIFPGDSFFSGSGASVMGPLPSVIWKLLNDTSILFNNMATYGLTITNLQAQFATDVTWQYDPSIPNVVVFMAGTNDLGGGASAATAYNSMKTYCNAVAAVGITKMVVGTLMDRSSNFTNGVTASSFNVARATYNNLLKTQLMTDCPVVKQIADVAADSRLGANGASIPTTYFVDGTHPNDAGYAIMASIFATAIRAA